jgi:hypothetical protein
MNRIVELLAALRRAAVRYRSWLLLGAATASSVLIVGAVRLHSARRAGEWEKQRAELAKEMEAAKTWLARFESPTPAESAAWRRSAAEVAALSKSNPDRLLAARLVAERAQAAGIRVVRVNFLSPDSLEEAVPPVAAEAGVSPADWVLSVEAEAGLAELARFLETLPPGLALWRLEGGREGGGGRAALRLLRYTLAEGVAAGSKEEREGGSK